MQYQRDLGLRKPGGWSGEWTAHARPLPPSPSPPSRVSPCGTLSRRRRHLAPSVLAADSAPSSSDAVRNQRAEEVRQDAALRLWIQEHGGFVHESISITSDSQCGARGLVASRDIGLAAMECAGSLVVVPRHLHLSNAAAVEAVGPRLDSSARREAFSELGQLQQVACCLAMERAKGSDSFWLPYLRTLPAAPPNPWLLHGQGLAEVLEAAEEEARLEAAAAAVSEAAAATASDLFDDVDVGEEQQEQARRGRADVSESGAATAEKAVATAGPSGRGGWAAAVEVARRRYGGLAEEVLEVVGTDGARSMRLEREGLMWALGQVVSRSLGSGRSSGLLPYVDMANHHPGGRPPMMMLDEQDRIVFAVTNIREGELAPLAARQELFISYQAEDMSPLKAWLKWGFVPQSLPPSRR